MENKPLDFIDLLQPATGRTSSLSIYGRQEKNRQNQLLGVTGGLSHGSLIEPATVHDADKLIAWLKDWKSSRETAA